MTVFQITINLYIKIILYVNMKIVVNNLKRENHLKSI
jgi:hypothetical protein